MKKIIYLAIILTVVGLIYFFWPDLRNFFMPENGLIEPPPVSERDNGRLQLKSLTADQIVNYWFYQDEIYYLDKSGQVFKISTDGRETNINQQNIAALNSIEASFDGSLAAALFGGADNQTLSFFDVKSGSWEFLSDKAGSAAWSPNQNSLAYLKDNGLNSTLMIVELPSKKSSEITKINQVDLGLVWAFKDEIYLSEKPSANLAASSWLLNIKTKTIKPVFNSEPGLIVNWSKNQDLGLKSNTINNRPALSLINSRGQTVDLISQALITLPNKCFFEESTLWCGAIKTLPAGANMPDDYLKRKAYSQDYIISWEINSRILKIFFDNDATALDVERLIKKDSKIYFVNRYDRKLYSLNLEINQQ